MRGFPRSFSYYPGKRDGFWRRKAGIFNGTRFGVSFNNSWGLYSFLDRRIRGYHTNFRRKEKIKRKHNPLWSISSLWDRYKYVLRKPNSSIGFTLVELLVVIGVLAVLATVVLLAVNPGEQLARGRDSDRISAVTQLGKAVVAAYTNKNTFPTANQTWMNELITSGELRGTVTNPKYDPTCADPATSPCSTHCVANGQNGYCYVTGSPPPDAYVFVRLESSKNREKCGGIAARTYALYSTRHGRGGVACTNNNVANPNFSASPNWTWAAD
jgi:prepilin-type N-terminal cleavage/methylation domain-containing protein